MDRAASSCVIGKRLLALATLFVFGCAGWHEPKLEQKHIDQVNGLFNDRSEAALDVMKLLKTDPAASVAGPQGVLTSDEAVQLVLQHNLSLAAEVESLPIAQANLVQAGLWQNPGIGQTGAFYFPISAGAGPATAFDLEIDQVINTFFTQPHKVAIAKAQRFQAGIDLANQAFGLAQQTRAQFDSLASLERSRQLQQRIAQTYKKAVDEAQAQMRVGLVTRVDVNRALIQYEDAVRQERHFQTQFESAAQQMNWLMGVRSAPLWRLPTSVKEAPVVLESLPTSDSLEKLGVKYRLDLLRATFDQKIAETSVKLAKLGIVPGVTVGFDAARDNNKKWTGGPAFGTSLPIFDPGIVALWLARYQQTQTKRTYVALEGQVHQDVHSALYALQIADEDVRFYKERIIPQEEENVREQQLSFRLGNAQFDDLLNTIREYVGVLQNYEAAIQAYQQAIVGLETAVGLSYGRILEKTRNARHYDTALPFVAPPATLPAELPSVLRPGAFVPMNLPPGLTTLPTDTAVHPTTEPQGAAPSTAPIPSTTQDVLPQPPPRGAP